MDASEIDENGNPLTEPVPSAISPPSELAKVSLPRYRVAPPDILVIQAIRLFPKDPYYIQSSDYLQIIVPNALFDALWRCLIQKNGPIPKVFRCKFRAHQQCISRVTNH